MAIKRIPLNLTLLNLMMQITTLEGKPTPAFVLNFNNALSNILVAFNGLAEQQADQQDIIEQIILITGLVKDVDGKLTSQSIINSSITPAGVLSSTYDTASMKSNITISAHTRNYTDGTSKPVSGGTLGPFDPGSYFYVYYDDPLRLGGDVSYQTATDPAVSAQTAAGRHSVGGITLATATESGSGDNPGYPGVPRCVDWDSYMPGDFLARESKKGSPLLMLTPDGMDTYIGEVRAVDFVMRPCIRITTTSGATLVVSTDTPITLREGICDVYGSLGKEVPVWINNELGWEIVTELKWLGDRKVAWIDAHNGTYAAGEQAGKYIFTHNKPIQQEQPDIE